MALAVIEKAGLTDVGRQRRANEDSMLEADPVFAVADGMGGARAGEVASQTAVEMLQAALSSSEGSPEERLEAVAQAANTRIYQLAQEDEARSGMGTTFTAVMVDEDRISVGHVGDSRLYRLRDESLERLTRDHSLVEELVRRGELDPEDVESHPQRAIITRALGPSPDVEVETFTAPAKDDDVYLICSDGLTTMVREPQIADILRSRSSLDDAAHRLVNTANENGGRDNVTVVLFRLGDEAAGTTTAPLPEETRADLRVEDIKDAAAATSAARGEEEELLPLPAATEATRSPRRRRLRVAVTVFLVLLSIGILLGGFWFGFVRQSYFVGTDSAGLITLYRGVPVDLWDGFSLYEPVTTTTVPAADLPERQRAAVLNHSIRTYGDAADLVRSLEEQAVETPPEEPQGGGDRGGGDSQQGGGQQGGSGGGQQGGPGQRDNSGGG